MPTEEEIMSQFAWARWFGKLDTLSGFWQIKLDKEAKKKKLFTFYTPEGRYRFLHFPYGILSVSEVYQKTILMIFERLPGVETIMDDIIMWGSTGQEHDAWLGHVLDLIRKSNLKLERN